MSESSHDWEEMESPPPLGREEVHVWHIRLEPVSAQEWSLLSTDEQTRAKQYRFAADRDRFVSCRAKLRRILAQYVGETPQNLIFSHGPHGKPMLSPQHPKRIEFNVSHSGDDALFAFAREMHVGVDIECLKTQLDFQNLADRFMSPREAAHVRDAADKSRAFYECWTRKEAWLKAIGCGLSEPLSRFDTSSTLGQAAGTVACEDFPESTWTIQELSPAPDLTAALAVDGRRLNFRCLREKAS